MVIRLTAGNSNNFKFFATFWVKQCREKTKIIDVVQEKLAAKGFDGPSKLLVKVCKILENT